MMHLEVQLLPILWSTSNEAVCSPVTKASGENTLRRASSTPFCSEPPDIRTVRLILGSRSNPIAMNRLYAG